jgi:kinetochore protein Mis13/DSN1
VEFQTDVFAHGVHALEQKRQEMDETATRVLALTSETLERRDVKEKERAGTKDMPIQEVLRALSRTMPPGPGRA